MTDAIILWGNEQDYKYFLPRIFEHAIVDEDWLLDPEIVFGRLRSAGWHIWPENERLAVSRYFRASWAFVLAIVVGLDQQGRRVAPRSPTLNVYVKMGVMISRSL